MSRPRVPRFFKADDVVKTADGTLCEVRSTGKQYDEAAGQYTEVEMVYLRGLETGAEVTLPAAELTRVPDPREKKPPIEGIPTGERPRCQWCGKQLLPMTSNTYNMKHRGLEPRILRRTFSCWRGYEEDPTRPYESAYRGTTGTPLFHSLGCASRFAGASWRGGYRRK